MLCTDCKEGLITVYFPIRDGKLLALAQEITCLRCNGTCEVPDETPEWIRIGREMKKRRIEKKITLREASINLEILPSQLSEMETGRICPIPEIYNRL